MAQNRYVTRSFLRSDKVGVSADVEDDSLDFLIEVASDLVDRATGQFFCPERQTRKYDGPDCSMLNSGRDLIPVQKIEWMEISGTRRDSSQYRIDKQLDRRVIRTSFSIPRGNQNVEIAGIFGWLEPSFERTATVDSDVSAQDSTIQVSDSRILTNDWIVYDGETLPVVESVVEDVGTVSLNFESEVTVNIDAGEEIVAYGRTPSPLRMAIGELISQSIRPDQEESDSTSSSSISGLSEAEEFMRRITSEETDDYSYSVESVSIEDEQKMGKLTRQVSKILSMYSRPSLVNGGAV